MINAFTDNPTLYSTPKPLIRRMVGKIKVDVRRALDPSAGKGDIIEFLKDDYHRRYHDIWAIEIDPDLQAVLRGKGIKVLDSDFLAFAGPDKFDLIIMNPPFNAGDQHLLKAIDIMYCGQIICLLNAETLRNPYTNIRKDLARKLEELGAEIEYIQGAFKNSERPTGVEIALVSIIIEKTVEEDLFAGADDKAEEIEVDARPREDLGLMLKGQRIESLVNEYREIVRLATETIIKFYENHRKIGEYLSLTVADEKHGDERSLTTQIQHNVNAVAATIRKKYWRKTLDLPEVVSRLTQAKAEAFHHQVEHQCDMDFTERNIRAFVLNLINGYQKTLQGAILDLFDKFTIRHHYGSPANEKNIHYFNGWKTNDAFKVRRRIVVPVHGRYCGDGGAFRDAWEGKWKLDYSARPGLDDIDIVMNYFDGMTSLYLSIADALDVVFKVGGNTAHSTYFEKIIAYKKGTMHLTFRDEDILRRFNIEACKGKGWLPPNYGVQPYPELDVRHRLVVDSFEGEQSYTENLGRVGLTCPPKDAAIEAPKAGQMEIF